MKNFVAETKVAGTVEAEFRRTALRIARANGRALDTEADEDVWIMSFADIMLS